MVAYFGCYLISNRLGFTWWKHMVKKKNYHYTEEELEVLEQHNTHHARRTMTIAYWNLFNMLRSVTTNMNAINAMGKTNFFGKKMATMIDWFKEDLAQWKPIAEDVKDCGENYNSSPAHWDYMVAKRYIYQTRKQLTVVCNIANLPTKEMKAGELLNFSGTLRNGDYYTNE